MHYKTIPRYVVKLLHNLQKTVDGYNALILFFQIKKRCYTKYALC